jgi:ribosomal protein L37AE/L43A
MTHTEFAVGCGVALLLVAALAVLHFLSARCPRCNSRNTWRCSIVPGKWLCGRCNRLFGPGTLTDI